MRLEIPNDIAKEMGESTLDTHTSLGIIPNDERRGAPLTSAFVI